jgi:hypothetical protein
MNENNNKVPWDEIPEFISEYRVEAGPIPEGKVNDIAFNVFDYFNTFHPFIKCHLAGVMFKRDLINEGREEEAESIAIIPSFNNIVTHIVEQARLIKVYCLDKTNHQEFEYYSLIKSMVNKMLLLSNPMFANAYEEVYEHIYYMFEAYKLSILDNDIEFLERNNMISQDNHEKEGVWHNLFVQSQQISRCMEETGMNNVEAQKVVFGLQSEIRRELQQRQQQGESSE